MRKGDEERNPKSCFNKSWVDEMLFVLLGRDASAPATIRYWVMHRVACGKNKKEDLQIIEALECAASMERELEIMARRK